MKFFYTLLMIASLSFASAANAGPILGTTTLSTWNVSELNASGDSVAVAWWEDTGNTLVSFSWTDNAADTSSPNALGIDQIYYNFSSADGGSGLVSTVYLNTLNTIAGATDITDDWMLNKNNAYRGGGGFGDFSSRKNMDPAGRNGLDPSKIIFQLDGLVTFSPNSIGAMFDIHARYGNGCSGWASDADESSITVTSDTNCGGSTQVPEPNIVALLGLGLLGMAFATRRRNRQV